VKRFGISVLLVVVAVVVLLSGQSAAAVTAGSLTVTILSAETNQPLSGAALELSRRSPRKPPVLVRAMSDGTGVVSLRLQPGTYSYLLRCEGFGTQQGTVRIGGGATVALPLPLNREARIVGRIVASGGTPLPNLAVSFGSHGRAQTDAAGRFAVTALDAGWYELAVDHPIWVPEQQRSFTLAAGERKDAGDVVVRKAGALVVQLLADGRPLAGAEVSVSGTLAYRYGRTDAAGQARFAKLPPGSYSLESYDERLREASMAIDVPEGMTSTVRFAATLRPPSLSLDDAGRVVLPGTAIPVTLRGLRVDRARLTVYAVHGARLLDGTIDPNKGETVSLEARNRVSEQSVPLTVQRLTHYRRGAVKLAPLPPGLYQVVAEGGGTSASTTFLVTRLGLVAKTAPGGTLLFAADLLDGRALADVQLAAVNVSAVGAAFAKPLGTTGADGLLDLPGPVGTSRIIGRWGEHLAVFSLAERSVSPEAVQGYLYTERPAYRPGQTVYFKGLLRKRVGEDYALPGPGTVRVTVTDSSDQTLLEQTCTLSATGSFVGELLLPEQPSLGEYTISAEAQGQTFTSAFKVLEYRKPEFAVTAEPAKKFQVAGDPVPISLTARYYFGAPVVDGRVKYRLYSRPYYAGGDGAETNAGDDEEQFYGYADFVQEGEATTDAAGRALITIAGQAVTTPIAYTLELDVADLAGREVSTTTSFVVTPSLLDVRVRPLSYLSAPGSNTEIELRTASWEGVPRAARVLVTIEEQLYDRQNSSYSYRTLATRDVATDAAGRALFSQVFPRPGYWRMTAVTVDERGLQAAVAGWVWVWREGFAWDSSYRQLAVELDKQQYRPGDTARVIIRNPAPGAALLLTVEGRELYSRQLVPQAGAVQVVDVPVTTAMAPYVFVAAVLVDKGRFYSQTKTLRVDHRPEALELRVTADKKVYGPGDTVQLAVAAQGNDGRPRRAELSLAVVDEALFAIAPERQADIYRFFRGTREHLVLTLNSFPRVYLGGAAKAAAALADDELRGVKVRKVFKDTAFWLPELATGADGLARAAFVLPDNLTTWRTTAVGFTDASEFGTGRGSFIARLDVMARLQPPRFLTVGDQLSIPGILTNMTEGERQVTGLFEVNNLSLLGESRFASTVSPGGTLRRDLVVRADAAGEALLRMRALARDRGDAMELTLPVWPRALQRVAEGNIVLRDQEGEASVVLPDEALAEGVSLQLTVAPTLAASLNDSLEELIDFPYGCVEQTLSRFLPAVQVKHLLGSSGFALSPAVAEKLDRVLAEGLLRLYSFQAGDGGWGWWQDSAGDPAMTAQVMYGLALARSAGIPVRTDSFERGVQSLLGQLTTGSLDVLPAVYRAYAAAGRSSEAAEQRIESGWRQLVPSQRVQYLAALLAAGRTDRARLLLKELQATVRHEGSMAWLQDDDATSWWYSWRWAGSAVETTALLLESQLVLEPRAPLTTALAEFLVRKRAGRWWNTTRGTAAVVTALAGYTAATGELAASFDATLSLNGRELERYGVAQGKLGRGAATITIPRHELQQGSNRLHLSRQGSEGALYLSARLGYYVPPELAESRPGLSIQRTVYRLTPRRMGEAWRMEYLPLQPGDTLAPGDDVEVRLTVDAKESLNFVIIEDRLPAGFEVREVRSDPRFAAYSGFWDWYTHQERHDERMAFFRDTLPAGRHEFRYVIYPELAGEMTALPAAIWPMYMPSLRSESGLWRVRVR
jgi:alpha-2-macroglobulin